jgi:signal transduction histidine kinase/nitrate/nitrite-specific signal transduction histidine kinase
MKHSFPPVCLHILLALLASIVVFASLALVISPLFIDSSRETIQQSRSSYLWATPPLMVLLAGVTILYLSPIASLRRSLRLDQDPPVELVRQARRVAFNAPASLFAMLVAATLIVTILANIVGLLVVPGYELALYVSQSVFVIAATVSTSLILSLVTRLRLRPVLVTTVRLMPHLSDAEEEEGQRLTIRTRVLAVTLALIIVACYLPSVLALNLVRQAVQQGTLRRHQQWAQSIAQDVAPLLDDATLIQYVEDTSDPEKETLPVDGEAFIVDGDGNHITRLPSLPPSLPESDEVASKSGSIWTVAYQIDDRPDWRLGVVYALQVESHPLVRSTAVLLLILDAAILALTLPFPFAVTADLTADLRRITRRLHEVARSAEVSERLDVLSLDEIGDLVRAYNEIQDRVQTQQETLQQEHRRLLALQAISSRISAIFDLEQLLDELAKSARTIFEYHNTLIFLVDEENHTLRLASSGRLISEEQSDRFLQAESQEILAGIVGSGEAHNIAEVAPDYVDIVSSAEVKSAIVAPMLVGGKLVGVFVTESDRPDGFEQQDTQLVISLANQAAAAIEAARLLQESRANATAMGRWARNLMLINRVATTLASSLDAHEILETALHHLVDLVDVEYGGALILEADGEHAIVVAEYPSKQISGLRLLLPNLPKARRAVDEGNVYQIDASKHSAILEMLKEQNPTIDFHTLLLVPMVAREAMIGLLVLAALEHPRVFSDEDRDTCQTVTSQAAVAVANARLVQDIQQQQRALYRKSQELATESSKLDAILNNVADGLVVVDTGGGVILSNPVFRRMAGLPSGYPLRGRPLADHCHIPELHDFVAQAISSEGQVLTENLELQDGTVLLASTTVIHFPPIENGLEEPAIGVIVVLRDITREVELDRAKTDFITAVSHELRTPLTSILGFASLIQREITHRVAPNLSKDDDPQLAIERIQKNLHIIEQESERITRLITDMLDIAKIEAGQMKWRQDDTDLTEVIAQAVAATTSLAEEKRLPVQVHVPDEGLPPVCGDRDRIIQVVTNLLANAIKFTERGKIEVRGWMVHADGKGFESKGPVPDPRGSAEAAQAALEALGLANGEWIVVSVTDTGVGIQPEDISYVFEKYRQVGDVAVSPIKGTGLGLPISKEIVEHHGGHIWVESEQGKGSTFSFALPVERFLKAD